MATTFTLPRWFDLHTHFRQGEPVADYIADHLAMGCAGALAMPNTQPPVAKVFGEPTDSAFTIEQYRADLVAAGAGEFEQLIVPLYLTRQTTVEEIEEGAKSGLLRACKYYPPHGTTNSEHGVPMEEWIGSDVLRAMEENAVVLCIHGEQHALTGSDYFDAQATAESKFYGEWMPRLVKAHPKLRIVCEHITTAAAADFVKNSDADMVAATITPQHLLYTVGHLIQGLKYHLYCLPIVKFEADRAALREAVIEEGQTQFFAGTDSAPHAKKVTECGCAAGCYTGGCAPQLYAMAFEEAGADLNSDAGQKAFERFLSTNGPEFYGFPVSQSTFTLVRESSPAETQATATALPEGLSIELEWSIG